LFPVLHGQKGGKLSVESFVIAELVHEGSPRRAFQEGLDSDDFDVYSEEFEWIVDQTERKLPVNTRRFRDKFPDVELVRSGERVQDLISDLKKERAFLGVRSAIDSVDQELDHDNALEKASQLREILKDIDREHSPQSDTLIKSGWQAHLDKKRELRILRESGQILGIPTGLEHFDVHLGGMQPSFLYLILGRPGDAKSFLEAKLAIEAMLDGRKVGFFSPEMNEDQHRCRFSTLLSANEKIQNDLNLKGAFRNRDLMDGSGFNMKTYKRFLEYCDQEIKGEIVLFTQKYRKEKMTVGYIETRVEEYGLEVVFVDPIYKIRPPKNRMLKYEQIGDIVDGLQDLAKGFNVPVIVSNQATRSLIGRKEEAPGRDTSFGADSPVQEADTVIGVKNFASEHLMRVYCSKNRYGSTFKFDVAFFPNIGRMQEVTRPNAKFYNGYDPEKAEELRELIRESHD